MRPAPIVWTYPELGADLTGTGSRERSDYLKRLIQALGLPKGSSSFWPLCLPQQPVVEDSPAPASQSAPPAPAPDSGGPLQAEPLEAQKDGKATGPSASAAAPGAQAACAPEPGHKPGPEPGQESDSVWFQAGLARLRPRAVVMFGPEATAMTGLPLQLQLPFTQQILRGMLFVLLPPLGTPQAGADILDSSATYLRSAFAGLPGIFLGG
ncbi:hypothetical protein LJC59_04185 [Desulfovibrio sp. OttesenSCG-928-A18]|nr:hypothetical protein [Desulfovibrio sp. OttesenSCG-928-A18]